MRSFASICLLAAAPATPALPAICSLCHNRPMTTSDQPERTRGALSPLVAFAILMALVAAGAAYALTRPTTATPDPVTAPEPSPTPSDHQLTDAEAIARFKELDAVRVQALEKRTVRSLAEVATRDSPVVDRLKKTVADLRRNEVVVDELWRIRRVRVAENTSTQIRLVVNGVSNARFFDEAGDEVTEQSRRQFQTVECTMRLVASNWLLHDCTITAVGRESS